MSAISVVAGPGLPVNRRIEVKHNVRRLGTERERGERYEGCWDYFKHVRTHYSYKTTR